MNITKHSNSRAGRETMTNSFLITTRKYLTELYDFSRHCGRVTEDKWFA